MFIPLGNCGENSQACKRNKLYHISVEQEVTSSHWKVVCKQRLHCFDTTGESVYHIKPQPHAGPGIYGAFLLYNWRSSIVYHVCRWSVTSSNRNYFLVKLREENIVGCVAFWKKFVVSRLVLQSAWLASLKYLYFFYIITEKYNIWNIFTNSNVS